MDPRNFLFCLIFFLTIALITSCHDRTLQTQEWESWNTTSQPIFPEENWMQYKTPEEAGWSSDKLSAVKEKSNRVGSAAVMVIYNGVILSQWGQTSRRFRCHSIRKSLLSAIYGIAIEKGEIDIDESIGSIGIDDISPLTETEKSAKVSDLLKSRSGVYLPAAYEVPSMKENRPKRDSHKPGTYWYYNNWDFNALATIYNNKTSSDLFKAFENQIAVPTRMQDFELRHTYYHLEPENSSHPAYPFRMSARDLARIGLLYLNEGRWKKKQIVPADWVRKSTKPYSTYPGGGYGYMWWTFRESGQLGKLRTYAARGYGGHSLYVVPGANLVFVHRANTYAGSQKHVDYNTIRNMLLEVLKARTGPPLPAPKLITPDDPHADSSPSQTLTKAQRLSLMGKYFKDDNIVTVKELDSHLEITAPRGGNYFLLPRSATEFEIEDIQKRGEFELDETGNATAVKVWFNVGVPYEMQRVRNDKHKK